MKIIEIWKQYIGFDVQRYLFGKNNRTYDDKLLDDLCRIKSYCTDNPTCEGCPFSVKHEGCKFRGRSPKEW